MNENLAAALRNLDYQDPEYIELRREAKGIEFTPDQEQVLRGIDTILEQAPIVTPFDLAQHNQLRNHI